VDYAGLTNDSGVMWKRVKRRQYGVRVKQKSRDICPASNHDFIDV